MVSAFLGMQQKVAPRLSDVILCSQNAANDVAAMLAVRPDVMTVIPLGIDQDIFRPRAEIHSVPNNRLLTTASADVPLKGLPVLIEAYSRLLETHPDLELVVIGKLREGPTADLLGQLEPDRPRHLPSAT